MQLSRYLYLLSIIAFFFSAVGCHTTRKTAGKTNKTISFKGKHLSSKEISQAIADRYIDFQTLSARLHVDFDNEKEHYNNVTIYLRMKKDSAIWLSVRPVLGIEMVRILLTKDSIKVRNNLKNEVSLHTADELKEILHVPFDFSIIENLLVGNPAFLPPEANTFQVDGDHIILTFPGKSVTGQYEWSKDPFLLKKSRFQMPEETTRAEQQYHSYELFPVGEFSLKRNIEIQNSNTTVIDLSFDKIKFNEAVQFPFSSR